MTHAGAQGRPVEQADAFSSLRERAVDPVAGEFDFPEPGAALQREVRVDPVEAVEPKAEARVRERRGAMRGEVVLHAGWHDRG